ncbi:MAG: S1C family serine protease [Chloroflexota bacterium]|nr:S1C family serine protease [Chloroflexota bacterium]
MLSTMIEERAIEVPAGLISDEVSHEIVQMLERVGPSVVQVKREGRGGGAGFVWRSDGAIVTNYHVIAGSSSVSVQLQDGRSFPAKVLNQNPALDLALLKVEAEDLPAALVDDSSKLRVGELVFAVGHPWGQKNVVTSGIVSGVGHVPVPGSGRTAQYVRSDVRVAPGNSGGPMLNAGGAVVGITAMIFGGDMAVAIPSHVAAEWVAGLPSRRVMLGVAVQPVEFELTLPVSRRERRTAGLLLVGVDDDTPASRAGLKVGDVILAAGGRPVVDGETLHDVLSDNTLNNNLQLHVFRGGSINEVAVDLAGPPHVETAS